MAATPTPDLGFQNFFQATLTGDITASSTDILMDNIPNATEGFLVIEPDSATNREVIFYNSKTALKVVCPSAADGRGQDDTTATAHATGSVVIMAPVAAFWEAFQQGLAFADDVINTSKLKTASEFIFDHVASGCVWSGDSYGSTRAASMTSGIVYVGGKRVSVSAVTARTFTASKDTYVDVDNTGLLTYTEVSNNAASPALAGGSVRLAIIVTGASSIANVGAVNQGQEDKVLPIVSSIPYAVTDSLGNLICPRDPHRKTLGYAQLVADSSNIASSTYADLTGMSVRVIVPSGRKIRLIADLGHQSSTTSGTLGIRIQESTTVLQERQHLPGGTSITLESFHASVEISPSAGAHTYKLTIANVFASGNVTIRASSTAPSYFRVELV